MRSKNKGLMEQIKTYAEEYAMSHGGATPSTRDIGAAFNMSHVSAYRYLRAMDELGMIRYEHGEIRTDRIDKIEPMTNLSPSFSNAIPAGPADEVDGLVEEYVSIPSVFTDGRGGKFYILKVTGDSMVSAGIDSGDMVIIREQADAREGDIVASLINHNSSTLKRLCRDEQGLYLWAENDSWDDKSRFYGREFEVQGVAVKVVKDIG